MKLKNEGKATYIDYPKYSEMWSYQTLVVRYYHEEKGIVFYPKHDVSATTNRQISKWFFEHLGVEELASERQRALAIQKGRVTIGQKAFRVIERLGKQ